jgi:hypothetical protein
MRQFLRNTARWVLRYWFWLEVNRPLLDWKEFWIERNFEEYLKFRKFARWHQLYDENLEYVDQESFIMLAILHDYFFYLGYRGVVQTENFDIKYLIWRYTPEL